MIFSLELFIEIAHRPVTDRGGDALDRLIGVNDHIVRVVQAKIIDILLRRDVVVFLDETTDLRSAVMRIFFDRRNACKKILPP